MPDQLTGHALDRAACETVGIEPGYWTLHHPDERHFPTSEMGARNQLAMYREAAQKSGDEGFIRKAAECEVIKVYPRVSTWEGVGLLVERLQAMGVPWSRTPLGYVKVYNTDVLFEVQGIGVGPLPEALARAVVAWKEAQGG
jgi:hypothetical protein